MTESKTDWNAPVAEVEGTVITEAEVEALLHMMGEHAAQFQGEAGRNRLKDELVHQELLVLDARERKLDEEPDFLAQLEVQKKQLLQQYALHRILSEVQVSEEELRTHYEQHMNRNKARYRFNANHILVDSKERAEELKKRIEAGERFEDVARQESSCPSSKQGGSLGDFESGQMVAEFDQALTELTPGTVSDPVKTGFGYHLIRLNRRDAMPQMSFEEARDAVASELTLIKQQAHYMEQLEKMGQKYSVIKYYGEH